MRKAFSLIGWWLAVLAILGITVLLPDIWYELHRINSERSIDEQNAFLLGVLIFFSIMIFESICFLRGLLTGKVLSMLRHIVPVLIIANAFLIHFYPDWGVRAGWSPARARFALFRERYEECAATAHRSYNTYEFNTCEDHFAGLYVHFLVYDTSGQIALPPDARSSEFAAYLKKPEYWMFTDCRLASTEFVPHFFI